jgi:hypothetical protein
MASPSRLQGTSSGAAPGLNEHGEDLEIVFDWRLRAEKPLLKSLSFLLKPLFRRNHRWAMERGEQGLRRELNRRTTNSKSKLATN